MVSLLLGIAAAAAASTLYSLGIAVQALDARDVHADNSMRLALLSQLVRRARWLAGTGMTLIGWPFQILALLLAPLVVVQPALAAGLLVLLAVGERMLGERAGRREHLAVAAIVLGVAGIAALAPARTTGHAGPVVIVAVLGVLGLAAAVPYLLRPLQRSIPSAIMFGAGSGFAWSAIATKLLADAASRGHWLAVIGWALASGAGSGAAMLCEMSALQVRPAIQVAPVVFVVQTLLPILAAPLLLHESFIGTPLSGIPLLGCLAVLLAGAVVLARSPLLLALMTPQAIAESGTPESRSAASSEANTSSDRNEATEESSVSTTTSPGRSGR